MKRKLKKKTEKNGERFQKRIRIGDIWPNLTKSVGLGVKNT